MQALTQAVYTRIAGDPTVSAWATTYAGGPAVFAGDEVPANAVPPYVHIHPAASDTDASSLRRLGREILQDISLHQVNAGNAGPISRTAERIRDLFHQQHLDVTGWATVLVTASGPTGSSDEPGFLGRSVTLRAILQRL